MKRKKQICYVYLRRDSKKKPVHVWVSQRELELNLYPSYELLLAIKGKREATDFKNKAAEKLLNKKHADKKKAVNPLTLRSYIHRLTHTKSIQLREELMITSRTLRARVGEGRLPSSVLDLFTNGGNSFFVRNGKSELETTTALYLDFQSEMDSYFKESIHCDIQT